MSGGSYSYLYCKDIDELFNSRVNLQEMADDLFAKYPQSQAAHDTRTLRRTVQHVRQDPGRAQGQAGTSVEGSGVVQFRGLVRGLCGEGVVEL